MTRSDKQIDASKKNGAKSRGPRTAVGKSKSSQNAKAHGLTGSIDPDEQEAQQLADLEAKLRGRYSCDTPQKNDLLLIILDSQLRMIRAYQLMDVYAARILSGATMPDLAKTLQIAMEALGNNLRIGDASRMKRADYLLGQSYLLIKNRELLKTKLSRLADYAQRFRGQRDRALMRLERLQAEHF